MNNKVSQRPKIKVKRTSLERLLGITSAIIVVMLWIYLFMNWSSVPDKIPTHFGLSGVVDTWGSKSSIIFLPILMTLLYLILTTLAAFPQYYNYGIAITKENAAAQYKNARTLMLWITLQLVAIFSYITFTIIQVGLGNVKGFGLWFLPGFLVVLFGTVIYYVVKMHKLK